MWTRQGPQDFEISKRNNKQYGFSLANVMGEDRPIDHRDPNLHYVSDRKVRHNVLHDMESLWWTAVYFLFYRKITRSRKTHPHQPYDDLFLQERHGISLFEKYYPRDRAFRRTGVFRDYALCLHPSLQPIGAVLNLLRMRLIQSYIDAEEDVSTIGTHSAKSLYRDFLRIFKRVTEIRELHGLRIGPYNPRQPIAVHTPANEDFYMFGQNVSRKEPLADRVRDEVSSVHPYFTED